MSITNEQAASESVGVAEPEEGANGHGYGYEALDSGAAVNVRVWRMAQMIRAHGHKVRMVTAGGVLAACACTTGEGFACSELSPVLRSWSAVRDWLGY